jgi:hypothetical protein
LRPALAPAQVPVGIITTYYRPVASGSVRARCDLSTAGADDDEAVFHQTVDLTAADFMAVRSKMRHRRPRCLRHPTADVRTELLLTPVELHDNPAPLVTSPHLHGTLLRGVGAQCAVCRTVARCRALLFMQIDEGIPLRCAKCGEPMRIIALTLRTETGY